MDTARDIIDANAYMTLATADGDGRPWASPVWFAHEDYTTFSWVSRPEARHSRNLAVRPQLAIVIFDSTIPEGEGQAVFIEAVAEQVADGDGIDVISRRSLARGAEPWTAANVTGPAALRLYRATATAHFLLGSDDKRIPLRLDR